MAKEIIVPDKLIKEIMEDLEVNEHDAKEIALMELRDKQNRRYEQSAEKKKKKSREKKIDLDKKKIVEILKKALTDNGYSAIITNIDRQIDFGEYTVTVTKHRPKKK